MLVKDQNNLKICISLGVLAIISLFLSSWTLFVENCYVPSIYPLLSEWLRTLSGFFPFNVGDWIYATLVLLFIRQILKRKWASLGILFFSTVLIFQLFWGINYYKKGIAA